MTLGVAGSILSLQWFYEAALVLHELLHEIGSIYVHLDYHVAHYAKVILDEIWGVDNLQNEIAWQRTNAHNEAGQYGRIPASI